LLAALGALAGWVGISLMILPFLIGRGGTFDAVLMLGWHPLLVGEREHSVTQVLLLAFELTTNLLIVEFVAPSDSMFRLLTRGRDTCIKT